MIDHVSINNQYSDQCQAQININHLSYSMSMIFFEFDTSSKKKYLTKRNR